jgi:hypothetical protein
MASIAPNFDIRTNVDQFKRGLNRAQRDQLPFATFLAVNATAEAAVRHNQRAMGRFIDRPKPFTVRGIYARKGRYRRGNRAGGLAQATAEASLMWREFAGKGIAAKKYLRPIVFGGARGHKRHEVALQRRGYLSPGSYLAPAPGQRLNAYGNLPGSRYVQILSALGAFEENGYVANRTARSAARGTRKKNYFYAKRGQSSLHPGVYQRYASGRIKPVLIEIKQPVYRRRYDFFGISEQYVRRALPVQMRRAMQRAMTPSREAPRWSR